MIKWDFGSCSVNRIMDWYYSNVIMEWYYSNVIMDWYYSNVQVITLNGGPAIKHINIKIMIIAVCFGKIVY